MHSDPAIMHAAYDPALVTLSIAIAVFASYTALDLGSRVRTAVLGLRWAWIAGAALAMGGGIWAMHFVGMLAFEMGMPAAYDLRLTVGSLLIAVGVTGAAFALVSRQGTSARALLVSGPLMGVGVAAMHYTGMAAMRVPGNVAYSLPVVALSVGIAITAATAALWLTFRQHGVWQKLLAALVMGVAVAGMHYTGMAAAAFTAESEGASVAHAATLGGAQVNLALSVAGATFVILFLAMLTSSLDQQRVQSELRLSEARFRAAVQAVRGVLWTTDAEGRMAGDQPGWTAITGQSTEQYEGLGWADAVHPDDAQSSIEAWQDTVRDKRTFTSEHRLRSHDGTFRHYAIRAVPTLDEKGAIREWVGVHTDIMEQREAEAELRESNEELQRYAYIVSHDLRAPLVNVMGFAGELAAVQGDIREALATHPQGRRIDADLDEALSFIKASVTRMERLIAAILKLSRDGRRSFRAEPLLMSAVMQGLVDAHHYQFEAAGAQVHVAPELPRIEADRVAVEQIFANLIDNAVKYLDAERAGRIEVSGQIAGGFARFDVADNGRGIEARDCTRIFELFRRAGVQDRPGEGIGLAHVKALVRSLGGRITVASKPGLGTTFSVSLPLNAAGRRGYSDAIKVAAE